MSELEILYSVTKPYEQVYSACWEEKNVNKFPVDGNMTFALSCCTPMYSLSTYLLLFTIAC